MVGIVLFFVTVLLMLPAQGFGAPPKYELIKKFGPDGTGTSKFASPGSVAVDQQSHTVYAAGGTSGSARLYKFDSSGNPVNWGGSAPYISGNELSDLIFAQETLVQAAVDSTTHTVYVTSANTVKAFQENGEPADFTAGPAAGSNAIGGFGELSGLTVDMNGVIYASDLADGVVKVFAPTGEPITQFSVAFPTNLAVDSLGSIYVIVNDEGRNNDQATKFTPSSFPVSGGTTYSTSGEPVDTVNSYAVGVDPVTNFVYVSHNINSPGIAVYDESGNAITTFGVPGSDGELSFADGVAIDGAGTRVYVMNLSASNVAQVSIFQPEPPAKPAIEVVAATDVSSTAAFLYARINPDQRATTFRFEYGLNDCSTSICTAVPAGGASIAAGNDSVWVSEKIQGLSPGTQYHFRVVAENELGIDEADGVFRTQGSTLPFSLSDSRAWEMVSPPNKRGALLRGVQEGGGTVQAAADGNGIAYVATAPVADEAEGSRVEPEAVLARRTANGWESENLTTANDRVVPASVGHQGEYKLFSADLSKAALEPRTSTPLSEEASERAPYLRFNTHPPVYRPLVTGKEGFANVPSGTEFGNEQNILENFSEVSVLGATPDLKHVVLASAVPLVEGAPPGGKTIYEWNNGQLKPISVLPAADGEQGTIVNTQYIGAGPVSQRHAISDDGSRVFWTEEAPEKHLYMREMEAGKTVQIDQPEEGISGSGKTEPVFQGASADGAVVFFTDTRQLTADASPTGADLYRCEIIDVETACSNLVDLTAPREGSGESAETEGTMSGLSEDGSRGYFVAKGILASGANEFGQEAVAGEPNLYFWQDGEGLRFLATLANEDSPDWGFSQFFETPFASFLAAAISPNGRYFAFMSKRDLTEQSSIDVGSGKQVERVFRFDAQSDQLLCVSCSSLGAAPQGTTMKFEEVLVDPRGDWPNIAVQATLPEPAVLGTSAPTSYQPRAVLDNGRVFFNAFDSLVPADSNKQWDVYQYEDLGLGDCSTTSGSAAIQWSGAGCVSLLSSGTGEGEAGFLDSSANGDDVFFLTPARLSVTDVDNELDVYDARVNGIPAVLNPNEECGSSESCHPASPQVQNILPGSASFHGTGNVKPGRKCPKGKRRVKRGGKQRCVAKKAKKHKHHRQAGKRRRVNR